MGLSIHYKGCLKSRVFIQPLTEEVADICKTLQWPYRIASDDDLEGISVTPENCETLTLTFRNDGSLASRAFMVLNMPADAFIFTKTQFAGMDTHMAIIGLLRYLREKYFATFELIDEGKYWETNDIDVLRKQFSRYEVALETVGSVLRDFVAKNGDTIFNLADRLEAYLNQRLS